MMHVDGDLEVDAEAAAKFATGIARESFKFEVIYVLFLAVLELAHLCLVLDVRWFDAVMLAALTLRAVILGLRWRANKVESQPWLLAAVAAALDSAVFGLAGFVADQHLQSCAAPLSQFLASAVLAYMVLFVLPRSQSLVVAPLCVVTHALGSATSAALTQGEIGQLFFGIVLMGSSACVHLAAKTSMECSRWQIFLVEKKQEAIQQKVQRVQEEFANENNRGILRRSMTDLSSFMSADGSKGKVDLDSGDQASLGGGPARQRFIPASVHSAPAMLVERSGAKDAAEGRQGEVSGEALACMDGDCLPPDALVWLEGEAIPRRLEDVTPGRRILCFDRLGGHLKHAAVIDARKESGKVVWAKVTLDDGTVLDVTADHPVQPVGTGGVVKDSKPAVNAGDLQPGIDSLMVLKVVPVKVQRVETVSSERPRIYMTVQQPERHAVFVATNRNAGNNDIVQSVAVESANVGKTESMRVTVSNTFLKVEEDTDTSLVPKLRYSHSSPPGWLEDPEAEERAGGGGRGGGGRPPAKEWDIESQETPPSCISQGEASIILTGPLAPIWDNSGHLKTHVVGIQSSAVASQAVLSDYLGVKATGLASIGSLRHAANDCNVCLFENRRQHRNGKPCFKGAFCERCHECHDEYKKWKGKHLQRKRLESDGYPSLPGQTPPSTTPGQTPPSPSPPMTPPAGFLN